MTNKDLIRQYVDTGVPIPESQLLKLSSNDKKTYFRKRIIASEQGSKIKDYEFLQMSPELKRKYVDTGIPIPESQFFKLSSDDKKTYIIKRVIASEHGKGIEGYEFLQMSPEQRKVFVSKIVLLDIAQLLYNSPQEDKIIDILLSTEGFISNMIRLGINSLILYSSNQQKTIDKLLSTKEFISKLDYYSIIHLISLSSQKDKVKQDLINAGISKDVINSIITNHKIKTELIPESDESKLRKKIRQFLR